MSYVILRRYDNGYADVERAVGAPVVAHVPYDPLVWRSVDAGLLAAAAQHDAQVQAQCPTPDEWEDPSDYAGMGWIGRNGRP